MRPASQDHAKARAERCLFSDSAGAQQGEPTLRKWRAGLALCLGLLGTGSAFAAPANDSFADRIPLVGWSVTVTGSNVDAGGEGANEPNNANASGGHSVWWTWTAPFNGLVEIDTIGSDYDTTLGVYTGTGFPLNSVAEDDDAPPGAPGYGSTRSYVSFYANAYETYQILVDGWSSSQGTVVLRLNPGAAAFGAGAQSLLPGATASFSAAGGGAGVTYQWRRDGVDLVDGDRIFGATDTSLYVTDIGGSDGGEYSMAATSAGGTVFTDPVLLLVYTLVTSQPASLVKTAGSTANFSVTATGFPSPTYQWRKDGVDLYDGGRISGAWTPNLNIANVGAGDAGGYTVHVQSLLNETTSDVATLAVNSPPTITGQPVSLVRTAGAGASFSVTAIGMSTLTYQWRKNGVNLVDGGNVSGATTATLNLTNVQAADAASYTVAITNPLTTTLSAPATLSLNANDLFAGATPLAGASVAAGGSNLTAAAEIGEPGHAGTPASRSVWWRWTAPATGLVTISTAGSNFDTVLGVYTGDTLATLAPVAANDDSGGSTSSVTFAVTKDTLYQIAVDGYLGATGTVALGINLAPAPVITAISPPRQVVNLGQNLTLTPTVTGPGPLTYQWKRNGRPIAGATSTSYTITGALPTRDNGWYQLVATNGGGATVSETVFVNVAVNPGELIFWGDSYSGVSTPPGGLTSLVSVVAGGFHVAALQGDGSVAAWGSPYGGVSTPPATVTNPANANVVAIAAGSSHSLALKSDGTAVAWGYNIYGEGAVPTEFATAATARLVSVAAGSSHNLGLRADGTVVAWGSNAYNQIAIPEALTNPATANVVAIAAGDNHSLALQADGTVVAWGRNNSSQATLPGGLAGVMAIAAGAEHSVALKNDGTVVGWGKDADGQSTVPNGLTGVAGIAAAGNHTVAFKSGTGAVVAWGSNSYGASTPLAGLDKVVGVTAGFQFGFALRNAAAGNFATLPVITQQPQNQSVALGDSVLFQVVASAYPSTTYQWRKGGVPIPGKTNSTLFFAPLAGDAGSYDVIVTSPAGSVTSSAATLALIAPVAPQITAQPPARNVINAGDDLTLSVTITGAPTPQYVWRHNGKVVGGSYPSYSVSGADPVRDNGWYQVEVTNSAGTVRSQVFFVNVAVQYPQILDAGSTSYGLRAKPDNVGLLMAVEAGGYHTLGLRTDGTVVAWGGGKTNTGVFPEHGQSIVPAALADPATAQVVALAGGGYHSAALTANGAVVAWGYNSNGQASVPADLADPATAHVVAISAGDLHTIALRADGTVRGWGHDGYGQSTVPSDLANPATAHVVAISAGRYHNLALREDGSVRAWGYNAYFQASPPSFYESVVGISAGGLFSAAIPASGSVTTWNTSYFPEVAAPYDPNQVVLVAAGGDHVAALHSDGTVFAWGDNSSGQTTMPDGVTGVFALSAGEIHTVMLRDGAVPWLDITLDTVVGANLGDPATFDPTVTNLPPFGTTYQWFRNGTAITSPSADKKLVWSPVTMNDLGADFTLVATTFGSPPQEFGPWNITVNGVFQLYGPYDVTTDAGQDVELVADLQGFPPTPPTIHWEKDGTTIPGANTTTLSLPHIQPADAGHYVIVAHTAYQEEVRDAYVVVHMGQASVTVESRVATFDGTPKSVLVSTVPANLGVDITYNGSPTPPADAGVYSVHAAVNNASYTGEANGTLTITPAAASVTVVDQVVPYDGSARLALANTTPVGLPVSFTYNGLSAAPTASGHYDVVATIASPNYTGTDTGSLDIIKATPTVSWTKPADVTYGTALGTLQLNATANTSGAFTYSPAENTVLSPGTHQLTVSFKPNDIASFNNGAAQTEITVLKASQPSPVISSGHSFSFGAAYTATANSGFGALEWALGSGSTASGLAIDFVTGAVTSTGAGTAVIKVRFAGDDTHAASAYSADFTITINKLSQPAPTISSGSSFVFGSAYTAAANGGFGALDWALGSGSTAAGAAIDAATGAVTATGVGSVVIKVRFAGDATHNASAYTADFAITVNKASQLAPVISSANSFAFGSAYTATANSGFGALDWALGTGSTAAGAAINATNGAVTATGVGTVVIKVRFAGDATHLASAYSGDFTITVSKANQSAPVISSANAYVFGNSYTATANSGFGALDWALGTGSTAAGAAINATNGAVTATGVGAVVIRVRFAGDATHNASAYTADFTVTVNKASQSAPVISSASSFTYGSAYTATANSGFGAIEWALGAGSTASGAAINAATGAVAATSGGTVVIKARFAGDATHSASAFSSDFTITVNKLAQSAPAISSASSFTFGSAYTATANSGFGALDWALGAGSTAAGAAINATSGAVTATGAGTVVIKVRFAGDTTHNASPYTSDFTITVNKLTQSAPTISSAGSFAFGSAYAATANSGFGALDWALGTGSTAAGAAINAASGAVTSTGVGTVVIKVRFAGDATHLASAYSGDFTITVNKAAQVAPAISSANSYVFGNSYTATANSGFGAVEWALGTGSTAAGAAINATTGAVTSTGYGTVVIKSRFAGDATHNVSAYTADFTVTVTKQLQPAPVISSASTFVVGNSYTATANSGFGALEWTLGTGSTAAGAAINAASGAVTATSGGTVVIKARFAGDSGHEASPYSADFTVTVQKLSQSAPAISSGNAFTLGAGYTATANSGFGALDWALGAGSTAAGAAINATSGAVTATGAGTVVIKVRFAGDATHNASAYTSDFTLTVSKASQVPPVITSVSTFVFGNAYTATATTGFGALQWTLGSGSTATNAAIDAVTGAVTATSGGTVVIKVRFAGDVGHNASAYSADTPLTVAKLGQPEPVISSAATFALGSAYTATANSGFGALVWSLAPETTAPGAAIDATTGAVTTTGPGLVVIRVLFAGDATHTMSIFTAPFPITVLSQSFDVRPPTFDWRGYLAANPDVAAAIGSDPQAAWNHYINYGVLEGRTDGDFNVQAYLTQYPNLAVLFGSDLKSAALHWYTIGRQTGLRIPAGFDVNGYFARNQDIARAFANDKYGAWLHYFNYGLFEGRSFDANFIPAEYLELNLDLKAAGGGNLQGAVMHWLSWGHPVEDRMGRVPIGFNVDNYLARYPDLAAGFGGVTPIAVRNVAVWKHYIAYGTLEGRSDGDFEAYNYLATNPDLAAVFGSDIRGAALHWYFYGRREGRRIPGGFDVKNYRALYPDLIVFAGDDLYGCWLHYRDVGVYEGRIYDDKFRPADYLALNPDIAAVVGNNYRDALLHWLYYGQFEGRQAKF